jgi:hypothetical protein
MADENVHDIQPGEREDLEHTDTISTGGAEETAKTLAEEGGPIGIRVDRDPSNLGNDIPEEGDLTHPAPINQPLGRTPAM